MKQIVSKAMGVGAAVALLLSAQPATAQNWCQQPDQCCDTSCCSPSSSRLTCFDWFDGCGDWEFGAHALFWTPVACPFDYVVNSPAVVQGVGATGSVSALKCETDWGFRIFGRYMTDCVFVDLSYQWFDSSTRRDRIDTNLLMRGGNAPIADRSKVQGKVTLEYQNFDARIAKYLHRSCGCSFYLFGNARWVDLSVRRSVQQVLTTTGAFQQFTEKSSLEGGALGVGAGAEYCLGCDFGLFGDANILGVIAERKTQNVVFQLQDGTTRTATYPADTCITPEATFRLGLNYQFTFCSCLAVAELGYEMDYFWDAVAFPTLVTQNLLTDSNFAVRCENIGFSGLFFGAKILF